jgi:S1-C subfamily serine protease
LPTISREQLEELALTLEGVPVWAAMPPGAGSEAGLRYGDVVLALNGMRTTSIAQYVSAQDLRADGAELHLFRDGQELVLLVLFRPSYGPRELLAQLVDDGAASA